MNVNGIGNVSWPDLSSVSRKPATSNNNSSSFANDLADSVNLSSNLPGVSVGADGRMLVNIDDALTSSDKALVTAATGGLNLVGPNGVHEVNQLAVTIALDRAMGNLTGPVTASYLNNLKSSEQQTLALNPQQGNAGIAFDVLDKAFAFLAQQPENPLAP